VDATERDGAEVVVLDEGDLELPDLLTDLQDRTQLTRRTIQRVLGDSGRLDDFRQNPQQFIGLAAEAINRCKSLAMVDGIKYQRRGDEEFYRQELFDNKELTGYLRNLLDVKKSVHEQISYASNTERTFADELEKHRAVKVYAKLPRWFTIPTPLDDDYNPDWAVLIQEDGEERVYFVVETKSSMFLHDLRRKEEAKVKCGQAHFDALREGNAPATFIRADSVAKVLTRAQSKPKPKRAGAA
jgi:type III restriction enzyme